MTTKLSNFLIVKKIKLLNKPYFYKTENSSPAVTSAVLFHSESKGSGIHANEHC